MVLYFISIFQCHGKLKWRKWRIKDVWKEAKKKKGWFLLYVMYQKFSYDEMNILFIFLKKYGNPDNKNAIKIGGHGA